MSFDSSRFTFDSWNDFLGVVMQQGRVQVDADWNELVAQIARRIQAGSLDTYGRAVVPATTPNGFRIRALVDGSGVQHLRIGAGRMYVDGLLVENHGPAASAVWDTALAELSGAPAAPPTVPEIDLDYTAQPYVLDAVLPEGSGPYLVYLDVWKRAITYLEHPDLIDPAVGIDTTGRVQIVWQVKLLDVGDVTGVSCSTPDGSIPPWQTLIRPSGARLTTSVVPSAVSGPCCLNAATGYTGLENQLYRVEIHQGGDANNSGSGSVSATFKWSRDNASVITAVTAIGPATNVANNPTSQLTVASTGRDDVLALRPGDWIEITDDFLELNGQPGELHQIDSNGVSKALKTIRLQTPVSADFQTRLASDFDYHTRICRWDQGGKVYASDGVTVWVDLNAAGSIGQIPVPSPGTSLILENGVTVAFDLDPTLGNFHSGDFWTFPARAADGSVQVLTDAPPMGIHHHYARLSIVTFPDSATDCRTIWPPVVSAGGDCACSVCVHPIEHNAGTFTIAMAVEKVRSLGGGRICLGPGLFLLNATLLLQGLESVVLSGQGPATVIAFVGTGAAIEADNDTRLSIEDLTVFALASGQASDNAAPAAAGILLRNSIETAVERCGVFALAAAAASPTGTGLLPVPANVRTIAIVLDGFLIETEIRDNLLAADIGIGEGSQFSLAAGQANLAAVAPPREIVILANLEIANNFLPCVAAGVALLGFGSQTEAQLNIFLLEIAFRSNRALGCSVLGVGIAGVTMPDGAIRIADNHIDVSGSGIVCGADGAQIADNVVTQAMTAPPAGGAGVAGTGGIGIVMIPVPGGKLPIASARVLRNRISSYSGPGIVVAGGVLVSSIVGNSIMLVTRTGISVTGPDVPSEAIVRDNEVFNVVAPAAGSAPVGFGPQTTGAGLGHELPLTGATAAAVATSIVGIEVLQTTTAAIENNSVALIGLAGGAVRAIAIRTEKTAEAAITGNDISDVGSITEGAGFGGIGVLAAAVGVANISSNVVRQTSSGSVANVPFRGIVLDQAADSLEALAGEALINANMVYGNSADLVLVRAGHCALTGNLCKQAAQISGNDAVVSATALTCVASNNRVLSAGKLTGLSMTVPGGTDQTKATVVGNIVAIAIRLNGNPLPPPWAPLNLIA